MRGIGDVGGRDWVFVWNAPLSEQGVPAHAVPMVDHFDIEVSYRYAAYGPRGFEFTF